MSKKTEREGARADLLKIIRPGDTVYTVLRHRSSSGMCRWIDLYLIDGGDPHRITWMVGHATGYTYDTKREALKVQGCGTDVGFDAVYNLSRVLWPEGGPCFGPGCSSNDHSNGDREYTIGKIHRDGGYTLRHRWI